MALHPTVNIAVRAARRAGDIIQRSSAHLDELTVSTKSQNDFVSEVDRQAEAEIINIIRTSFPEHNILAEESGNDDGHDSSYEWIIDPLDGTTNYLRQFPQYSVSIGVKYKGRLEHAVVFDPLKDELFTASRGQGAQLNGRRIRVTNARNLDATLLATGFPFKDERNLDVYLESLRAMIVPSAGIRRAGSAALDLAYVAAGRVDGFWELSLKPWDIAAGILLVQEAGGMVTDFEGSTKFFESGHVVAGNPKVLKEMLKITRPLSERLI